MTLVCKRLFLMIINAEFRVNCCYCLKNYQNVKSTKAFETRAWSQFEGLRDLLRACDADFFSLAVLSADKFNAARWQLETLRQKTQQVAIGLAINGRGSNAYFYAVFM